MLKIDFRGKKRKKHFEEMIKRNIPADLGCFTYVEPFGGTFAVAGYLDTKPALSVYNDINDYGFDIQADRIHHMDFLELIDLYDSPNTVFYMDPPYYGKEHLYGIENKFEQLHTSLCERIKSMRGIVILSYEDCPFIRKLYRGFDIQFYDGDSFAFRNEIVITNRKRESL